MSDQQRLQRSIDKSEIYDLACKYMRGLDRLDIELLKSVFHEEYKKKAKIKRLKGKFAHIILAPLVIGIYVGL